MQWFTEEYDENHFRGNVLLCCDVNSNDHKTILTKQFPECNFYTTDFREGSDITADICSDDWVEKVKSYPVKFDFVISVATLEHVVDPIKMMRNIFSIVDKAIFHTVSVHRYHAEPVDCYRFMEDWPAMVVKYLGLKIKRMDLHDHFYVFFQK